jgi:hypothetical protein
LRVTGNDSGDVFHVCRPSLTPDFCFSRFVGPATTHRIALAAER